jgi:hypothetical protein
MQPGSSEYTPQHVKVLQEQVEQWAPFASFECLSDVLIPGVKCTKLENNWPGWFSKMNLFSPSLKGDFLFMDLDTVIVGDIEDILSVNRLTLLRDFYRDGKKLAEGLGGALCFFPEAERAAVWEYWISNPPLAMRLAGFKGDMQIFEQFYRNTAARWQDVVPGQIVSWKVNCKNDIVPPDARIVCFHGKPRPWDVGQFHHLYR